MHSCKDCPDRHYLCHDSCERYKKDCEERAARKKKFRDENAYYDYIRRQVDLNAAKKLKYEKRKRDSRGHGGH